MSRAFLNYLEKERDRLSVALEAQRSSAHIDEAERVRLRKQKLIVENQLVRWASDIAQEVAAA